MPLLDSPFSKKKKKAAVLQITRTNTPPVNTAPSTSIEGIKARRQEHPRSSPVLNPNTYAPWKGWFIWTRLQIFTEQRAENRETRVRRDRERERKKKRRKSKNGLLQLIGGRWARIKKLAVIVGWMGRNSDTGSFLLNRGLIPALSRHPVILSRHVTKREIDKRGLVRGKRSAESSKRGLILMDYSRVTSWNFVGSL